MRLKDLHWNIASLWVTILGTSVSVGVIFFSPAAGIIGGVIFSAMWLAFLPLFTSDRRETRMKLGAVVAAGMAALFVGVVFGWAFREESSARAVAPVGAVRDLDHGLLGSTSVEVRWTHLDGAVRYEIAAEPTDRATGEPTRGPESVSRRFGLSQSYIFVGLEPDTQYRFSVVAIKADGSAGPAASILLATIPANEATIALPIPEPTATTISVADQTPIVGSEDVVWAYESGFTGLAPGLELEVSEIRSGTATVSPRRFNRECEALPGFGLGSEFGVELEDVGRYHVLAISVSTSGMRLRVTFEGDSEPDPNWPMPCPSS